MKIYERKLGKPRKLETKLKNRVVGIKPIRLQSLKQMLFLKKLMINNWIWPKGKRSGLTT